MILKLLKPYLSIDNIKYYNNQMEFPFRILFALIISTLALHSHKEISSLQRGTVFIILGTFVFEKNEQIYHSLYMWQYE